MTRKPKKLSSQQSRRGSQVEYHKHRGDLCFWLRGMCSSGIRSFRPHGWSALLPGDAASYEAVGTPKTSEKMVETKEIDSQRQYVGARRFVSEAIFRRLNTVQKN